MDQFQKVIKSYKILQAHYDPQFECSRLTVQHIAHINHPKQELQAQVYLLSRRSRLTLRLPLSDCIVCHFLVKKHQQNYLVRVLRQFMPKSTQSQLWARKYLQKPLNTFVYNQQASIKVTPYNYLTLFKDVVQLVRSLHKFGLRLQTNLDYFLKTTVPKGKQAGFGLQTISINGLQKEQDFSQKQQESIPDKPSSSLIYKRELVQVSRLFQKLKHQNEFISINQNCRQLLKELNKFLQSQEDVLFDKLQEKVQSLIVTEGLQGFHRLNGEQYPQNCIVRVWTETKRQGNQSSKGYGVGFLIGSDLVITSAHLVYPRRQESKNNFVCYKVDKVYVVAGSKTIKARYRFPEQFCNKRTRENDYALLKLEQNVDLPYYLKIAFDYQQTSILSIIKVQNQRELSKVYLEYTTAQSKIKDDVINHTFKTEKGDSGSPIMIQLKGFEQFFFAISIHSGSNTKPQTKQILSGLGTKFTRNIMDKLIGFERELANRKISFIRLQSFKYNDYLDLIGVDVLRQLAETQKIEQKKMMQSRQQRDQGQQQLVQSSRSRFLQLQRKVDLFFHNYPSSIHILRDEKKLMNQEEERQQLIMEINLFIKNNPNLPRWIAQSLKNFYDALKLKNQDIKIEEFNQQIPNEQQADEIQGFIWQSQLLYLKFQKKKHYYYLEEHFIARECKVTKMCKVSTKFHQDMNIKDFVRNINYAAQYQLSCNFPLNSMPNQSSKFHDTLLTPYSLFLYNGYYEIIQGSDLYQFQYQVPVNNRQQLQTFFMQSIDFFDQYLEFLYVRRVIDEEKGLFALHCKFRTLFNQTFTDFMAVRQNYLNQLNQLIKIFILAMQFVARLHSKGLMLCSPIQFCILVKINYLNKLGFCFNYVGHPSALLHKVKQLIDSKQLTEQQIKLVHDYYPIQQILACKRTNQKGYDVEAFQKVDTWMVGKSLRRFTQRARQEVPSGNTHQHQLFNYFDNIIDEMTCISEKRLPIQHYVEKLKNSTNNERIQLVKARIC